MNVSVPTDVKFDDPTAVQLLQNLVVKVLLQDITILPCICAGSGFIDKNHRVSDWAPAESYLPKAPYTEKLIMFYGVKLNIL